eukprot:7792454-Prorocentrum_lima.AAC.1
MQQYMRAQDRVKQKENIHQVNPVPRPRARNPVSGPPKAKVAQTVEEALPWNQMKKDHSMNNKK